MYVHTALCVNLLMAINSFFFFQRWMLFAASSLLSALRSFLWRRRQRHKLKLDLHDGVVVVAHTHTHLHVVMKICVITAKKKKFNFARFFGLFLSVASLLSFHNINH